MEWGGSTAATTNRASLSVAATPFQGHLLDASLPNFHSLATSPQPKRWPSSDIHNLAIANRTGSAVRRQYFTQPLTEVVSGRPATCFTTPLQCDPKKHFAQFVAIHRLVLAPQQGLTRLLLLYPSYGLIGCLFNPSLVSSLQMSSKYRNRLGAKTAAVAHQ